jgi:hypothetical protein
MSFGRSIPSTDGGHRASRRTDARKLTSAAFLREPLLHFLLIGALIFVIYSIAKPSTGGDKLIEVTPRVRQSIVELFEGNNQRKPSDDELDKLIDVWILNEITYREALAQGLDKGDEMIRERIMQKMRLLVFGSVIVNEPTEAEIEQWFEARRDRYDSPDLVSFFELPVGGPEAEAEAEALLTQINAGSEPEEVRLRAHVFADRPRKGLEAAFGKSFVDQLATLPTGQWRALRSPAGWHIVRFESLVPGKAIELHEIETQVINDWKDERGRSLGVAAIRDLGKSYVIRRADQ